MGVVNVTPDSFSDGGAGSTPTPPSRHGLDLLAEGADLVDVGGESTRPGAARPDAAEELRRVCPSSRRSPPPGRGQHRHDARRGRRGGRRGGGPAGQRRLRRARRPGTMLPRSPTWTSPYVCMHWRGHAGDMQSAPSTTTWSTTWSPSSPPSSTRPRAAGIGDDRLVVDPGFGFAKTGEHNWELLRGPRPWPASACRCWSGSRARRSSGRCCADGDGPAPPGGRPRRRLGGPDHRAGAGRGVGCPGAHGARQPRRRRGRRAAGARR